MANLSNINNKFLVTTGGDVGIGTTSPNHKLEIIGNTLIQGTQGFNAANETADIYLGDTGSIIRGVYDVGTHIMTNGTERLTVRGSTGNVGIGETSPVTLKSATTLQVLGNIKAGATNDSGLISLGDIASTGANAGIWRGAAGAYAGVGNWLNIGGYDGITFTTGNADIASQTERMRIDSSGNVGIGAISMFTYGSSTLTNVQISNGGYSVLTQQTTSSAANGGVWRNIVRSAGVYQIQAMNDLGTGEVTALEFNRSGTSITTSSFPNGNVGIGTTSPGEKFDTPNIVIGGASISGTYRANSLVIDNTGGASRFYSTGGDASTKGSYVFNTTSSNGSLNTAALTIASNTDATFAGKVSLPDNKYLSWTGSNTRMIGNSDYLIFQVAASDKMAILTSGNVGIGTTSPSYRLDVESATDSLAGAYIQAGKSSQGEIQNTGLIVGSRTNMAAADYMGISFSGYSAVPARGRAAIGVEAINGPGKMDLVFMTRYADDGTQLGTADVKMTILSGGNVGIASQLYHLGETANNIEFTTGNFNINMTASNKLNIDANKTYLNNNTVLVNNNGGSLVIDGTGASELRMAGPNGYYSFMMSTQVRVANSITWSNLGTDGSPVDDAVSADLMTLKYNGFLGLGTTAPTSPSGAAGPIIDLSGSNPEVVFHDTNGTANNVGIYYLNDHMNWYSGSSAVQAMILTTNTGALTIAGTLTENSDITLKENIKPLESQLEIVNKLNPISYNKIGQKENEIGFIAQEVEKLLPELVSENDGLKAVAYGRMTVVLVKAIQELKAEIDVLKSK